MPKPVKQTNIRRKVPELKRQWWNEEGDRVAQSVFNEVATVDQWQLYRTTNNIDYLRLYSSEFNTELFGVSQSYQSASFLDFAGPRFRFNIVKSCIDTACAKISKNKPQPRFVTSGGDRDQQKRAKQLTKYLDGVFYQSNAYTVAQQVFRDACIMGTGAIKVFADDDNQIQVERLRPGELIVDDIEGAFERPQKIHQRRFLARDKVLAMFPDKESEITSAPSAWLGSLGARSTADQITVIESWHLPSSKKAKDGLHTISIPNCLLFSEPFNEPHFPIVVFRWSPRVMGFWGQGLAAELVGIQYEIARLLENIRSAQYFMSNPRVFIDTASQISTAQINNQIGAIIRYTGSPPQSVNWQAMSPEVYQHLENLYRKAYEITGISQLSAQSVKPAGINSGVAMREYQDIETERFILTGQRWESFFVELAHRVINLSARLGKQVPNLSVKTPAGKYLEIINWNDVKMDEDEFVLKCFPVSALPQSPTGRLQTIQELMQAGLISPQQGKQLLDYPDLEQWNTLDQAALEYAHKIMDDMVENGVYTPPEPLDNLSVLATTALSTYQTSKISGVSEDRLQLIRQFLADLQSLQNISQNPPGNPGGATPLAAPAPPPVSQLIPNVPGAPPGAQ